MAPAPVSALMVLGLVIWKGVSGDPRGPDSGRGTTSAPLPGVVEHWFFPRIRFAPSVLLRPTTVLGSPLSRTPIDASNYGCRGVPFADGATSTASNELCPDHSLWAHVGETASGALLSVASE